jgi:ABC-2 type transport system ATP-binding protein
MDLTIFILLVVAIVIFMSLRIYFHRRHSKMTEVELVDSKVNASEIEAEFETEPQSTTAAPLKDSLSMAPEPAVQGEVRVEASRICKSFGDKDVVHDVSFKLVSGEVFGLVGPNGAGKTTTIRMLMDIIKPDAGDITVFGRPIDESTKNRIGYLPEERGLYQKMRVSDSLVYLARLKDVDTGLARERAEELLRQVDMTAHQGKKVSELSRGMGQIIQFLVTIAHDPDILVLDEPFAGLDPVNRMLLKGIVMDLKARGKTIVLSTHMMSEVEEMCDRILMINKGRVVLYGSLSEIKWRYRNNSVFVAGEGDIGELDGVGGRKEHGKYVELFLDGDTSPQQVLNQLIAQGVRVDRFEVSTPSLNEIFIQAVKGE